MKLLICTQAVDTTDSNLGFFHRWIEEFAAHCEQVIVICLRKGEYQFPSNVRVLSLGKENGSSRIMRILKFFNYIRDNKNEYDAVFVHMNAEYIVLAGWLWKRWGKKIGLWYAHKSVTWALRAAMRFVDVVLTVASGSFNIPSEKLRAVGHGIDTELFKPDIRESSIETRLITAGRIASSKHLIEMLGVLDVLYERKEKFTFTIVGEPITPVEEAYAAKLHTEIDKRPYSDKIQWSGPLLHDHLPKVLGAHDMFFNFSTTGNMDKAGLEALAAGLPVLTTNEEFKNLLQPFGLYVASQHPAIIADALQKFTGQADKDKAGIVATLRNRVVENHSLPRLISLIVALLK